MKGTNYMDYKRHTELRDALRLASSLYSISKAERSNDGKFFLVSSVKVVPQLFPPGANAVRLNNNGKLIMEEVSSKSALFRFALSFEELDSIKDLYGFFEGVLEVFAKKTGFDMASKSGRVWGASAPTYKTPGTGDFIRMREDGDLEFRLWVSFAKAAK